MCAERRARPAGPASMEPLEPRLLLSVAAELPFPQPAGLTETMAGGAVAAAAGGSTGDLLIYVEAGLYPDVEAALNVYVADLAAEGCAATAQPFSGSAEELRDQLKSGWDGGNLEGALFVGDLPTVTFTSYDDPPGYPNPQAASYPHDLYFMDLDGTYDLAHSPYSAHVDGTGDVQPEIYVSRLTTGNLGGITGKGEALLINEYFARVHAYRQGLLSYSHQGIVWADDDWSTWGAEEMEGLYYAVLEINDAPQTTKAGYIDTLGLNYESLLVHSHGGATYHEIEVGESKQLVTSQEIVNADPRQGFYNLFTCSGSRYTEANHLIGAYVYGGSYGLNAVGSTKLGSMLDFWDYYRPLGDGDSVGQAFVKWFQTHTGATDGNDGGDFNVDWFNGMTMQGDPTLRPGTMGQPFSGRISGTVWGDQNGNGVRDAAEAGMADRTVFLDADGDGALGPGETSTTTDPSGAYSFADLPPGDYQVRVASQPGWTVTDPASGFHEVDFRSDQVVTGADFGVHELALSVDDVFVLEGDSGTVSAVFTVSLSAPSDLAVTVEYATADGTALAGQDYVAASDTLTFDPGGLLVRTITVEVTGDTDVEPDENFFVELSNATNGLILDGQGEGTILDDDFQDTEPPKVVNFLVSGTAWSIPDYSIPVGSAAQLSALGWSRIDQIKIVFSEDVVVREGDLALTGGAGAYTFSGFGYDFGAFTATWTVSADIGADTLAIRLLDAVEDHAGNALDGEWFDGISAYPSGDGPAGGDFEFAFNVLPGDANGDGRVNGGDYTLWADYYLQATTSYAYGDFNASGFVDGGDHTIWADNYLTVLGGESAGRVALQTGQGAANGQAGVRLVTPASFIALGADGSVSAEMERKPDARGWGSGPAERRWRPGLRAGRAWSGLGDYVDLLEGPASTVLAAALPHHGPAAAR